MLADCEMADGEWPDSVASVYLARRPSAVLIVKNSALLFLLALQLNHLHAGSRCSNGSLVRFAREHKVLGAAGFVGVAVDFDGAQVGGGFAIN